MSDAGTRLSHQVLSREQRAETERLRRSRAAARRRADKEALQARVLNPVRCCEGRLGACSIHAAPDVRVRNSMVSDGFALLQLWEADKPPVWLDAWADLKERLVEAQKGLDLNPLKPATNTVYNAHLEPDYLRKARRARDSVDAGAGSRVFQFCWQDGFRGALQADAACRHMCVCLYQRMADVLHAARYPTSQAHEDLCVVHAGGRRAGAVVPTFFLTPSPAFPQKLHADVAAADRERYRMKPGDAGLVLVAVDVGYRLAYLPRSHTWDLERASCHARDDTVHQCPRRHLVVV